MSDVDPLDVRQVEAVLEATQQMMGPDGVVDLLARLPGVEVSAGTPRRFLHAATPAAVCIGPDQRVLLRDPLVHEHVVSGVVLSHDVVPAGRLAAVLAPLVVALTRSQGSHAATALVLTAARETLDAL
jgi:hypothetical protein